MSVLRNLLKLCRFTKPGADDKQFPIQQVEYLGKAVDVAVVFPFGMHANIPEDFLGVLMQLSGQEQNRVVLPISPKQRQKGLSSGDVIYYSPVTGESILFSASGGITISGDVTYADNVTINGNLTVLGDTTLGANVTSNGKDISDTHVHSGVTAGVSNTGPVV